MAVVLIRQTRWMALGVAVLSASSRGDEMPPPMPIGMAIPSTPTWEQVLDNSVDLTQAPGAPPAGAATPPAAPSLGPGVNAATNPNNPFLSLGPTPTAPAGAQAPATPQRAGILQMIGDASPL